MYRLGMHQPCGILLLMWLDFLSAKSAERKPGSYPAQHAQICHLGACSPEELQALLQATEVGEVWGVGRKIGAQTAPAWKPMV